MACLSVLSALFFPHAQHFHPSRSLHATLFLDYFIMTLLVRWQFVGGECFALISERGVPVSDLEEEGKALCNALAVDLHL